MDEEGHSNSGQGGVPMSMVVVAGAVVIFAMVATWATWVTSNLLTIPKDALAEEHTRSERLHEWLQWRGRVDSQLVTVEQQVEKNRRDILSVEEMMSQHRARYGHVGQ